MDYLPRAAVTRLCQSCHAQDNGLCTPPDLPLPGSASYLQPSCTSGCRVCPHTWGWRMTAEAGPEARGTTTLGG